MTSYIQSCCQVDGLKNTQIYLSQSNDSSPLSYACYSTSNKIYGITHFTSAKLHMTFNYFKNYNFRKDVVIAKHNLIT